MRYIFLFLFAFTATTTDFIHWSQIVHQQSGQIHAPFVEKILAERKDQQKIKWLLFKVLKKDVLRDLASEFGKSKKSGLTFNEFDQIIFKSAKVTARKVAIYTLYAAILVALGVGAYQLNVLFIAYPAFSSTFNVLLGGLVATITTVLTYPTLAKLQQVLWSKVNQTPENTSAPSAPAGASLEEIYRRLNVHYPGTEQMAKNILNIDLNLLITQMNSLQIFVQNHQGSRETLMLQLTEQMAMIFNQFLRYDLEISPSEMRVLQAMKILTLQLQHTLVAKYAQSETPFEHYPFDLKFKLLLKEKIESFGPLPSPETLEILLHAWF